MPNATYTQSLVRSAIAPQTIASETAAKATSNRYAAAPGIAENHENGSAPIASSASTDGAKPEPPTRRVAAVAERDAEADEVVDDRDDPENEHVLGRDVADVLHPCQPRLEEREAGLHEEDEDRREDDPDRARRERELLGCHTRSTSSSRAPVRLWVTLLTGDIQQMPSPLT